MSRFTLAGSVLVLTLSVLGFTSSAKAIEQGAPLQFVMPGDHGSTPRLGFFGHMHYGEGMHIDSVPWGSLAQRAGLEAGDVITHINGNAVRTEQDYFNGLRFSGGFVRLTVWDVRGRGALLVTLSLNNGTGPVRPYLQNPGPIHNHGPIGLRALPRPTTSFSTPRTTLHVRIP